MRIAFVRSSLLLLCAFRCRPRPPAETAEEGRHHHRPRLSPRLAVEQADLLIEDAEGDIKQNDQVPALTYRLQGDKSVLKELKDKHDRMVVQVKGILRSELSRSGIGTDVGRTRITIGADPRNPTRGAEQPLPVLEAKSFEATTVSCGK